MESNEIIIEPNEIVISGMILTSIYLVVPLDYKNPNKKKIILFLRKVVSIGKKNFINNLPFFLYLEGGPGK